MSPELEPVDGTTAAVAAIHQAFVERDALRARVAELETGLAALNETGIRIAAQRDRYREALGKIRQFPMHPQFQDPYYIADEALKG